MPKRSCWCEAEDCPVCKKRRWNHNYFATESPEKREQRLAKARVRDRARYQRDKEKRTALSKEWTKNNREKVREIKRAWKLRNPEKDRAKATLNNAIYGGHMERGSCEVCGSPNAQGHHDDYSKPLEVRWLCPTHHHEHHRNVRWAEEEAA